MQIADGNSEGVGRICRLANLVQLEESRDHQLHLPLLRPSIPDDCGLDCQWSILSYLDPLRGSCQHCHSANLPQLQSGLDVHRIEHILDGDPVRPMLLNQAAEALENRSEERRVGKGC